MWHAWIPSRPGADMLALEGNVERAGRALACVFSSSAEFEAAVIKSKLDAGVYGPKRRRRHVLFAGIATGILIVFALLI
jgi:hypothetical protein